MNDELQQVRRNLGIYKLRLNEARAERDAWARIAHMELGSHIESVNVEIHGDIVYLGIEFTDTDDENKQNVFNQLRNMWYGSFQLRIMEWEEFWRITRSLA